MYIYMAKVKQGENFSIRVFKTKAGATKAVKTAQATLYLKMEHDKDHDMHVDYNGFDVYVPADPDVKHKKEKVTKEDGKEVYYVNVYGKNGDFYYHKLAGYVKKVIVEY